LEAVLNGKILNEEQRKTMVWDIERGQSPRIEPFVWQTDTCIGDWHYQRSRFDHHSYKNAKTVVQMLADIVSKNGNLLLNIPVRGDGSIDSDEEKVLEGIAAWMDVNKESIFGTRPWKIFGEGPASEGAPLKAQGFNEGKGKAFTAEDVRFTTKGDVLYAIVLGSPTKPLQITSLGIAQGNLEKLVGTIKALGSSEMVNWTQTSDALTIQPPQGQLSDIAVVYKITPKQ